MLLSWIKGQEVIYVKKYTSDIRNNNNNNNDNIYNTYLRDLESQTDHQILARRPNQVIINKKENLYSGLC